MSNVARVIHELPGRTRVKVSSKRGNPGYFAQVCRRLSECPGVAQVEANFRTGSLLIKHTVSFSQVADFAGNHELFTLQVEDAPLDPMKVSENTAQGDARVPRPSKGNLDVRSIVLVALLTMSLVQALRGQILAPASTLLWYALELSGVVGLNSEGD